MFSKVFNSQQGRLPLGFRAKLAGWHLLALSMKKPSQLHKVGSERARETFSENWEDLLGLLRIHNIKKRNGEGPPSLIQQQRHSTTHMSASSSRLLVSAEKEVPKFRSSSSLILSGNHNVYRFWWVFMLAVWVF